MNQLIVFFQRYLLFPPFNYRVATLYCRKALDLKIDILDGLVNLILEPVFYLMAFGFGVGYLVSTVFGLSYLEFVFPAIVTNACLFIAFIDGIGFFDKNYVQNREQALLFLSPLCKREIVFTDVLWGASRSALTVSLLSVIGLYLNLLTIQSFISFIVLILALCLLFSALGIVSALFFIGKDRISYMFHFFIFSCSLFCNTYFPNKILPVVFQKIIGFIPYTWIVDYMRLVSLEKSLVVHNMMIVVFILVLTLICINLAIEKSKRVFGNG